MKAAVIWFLLIWNSTSQTSVQVFSEEECRAAVAVIDSGTVKVNATCVSVPFGAIERSDTQPR